MSLGIADKSKALHHAQALVEFSKFETIKLPTDIDDDGLG